MLVCDKTVTVIHHIKDDDDTYKCSIFKNASWFKKLTIATSEDGAKPVNTYDVRIMTGETIVVSPGDFVALGVVENITKPSDLKDLDSFRITAVGDNRRGMLSHWRLSGQ